MFDKFHDLCRGQPEQGEDLADVLFEIGKSLHDRSQYEVAITWLERALDALEEHEIDRLSDEAGDLKLAIMQKLSMCLDVSFDASADSFQSRLCSY
jgi:predicted ATPase